MTQIASTIYQVLQCLSFFRQHVAWTIQYELPCFVKTNKSVGHHPLPVAPNPGRNGCQRRRPPAQRFAATAEPLSYDDSSVCHRKLTFLMKIPWCFLSKMRKHNSKSNKNQRNDPEEINFWWFSNCCLFHLVSIPACRTSRSSLSCYVPHSLGGCIYHLTQRFENLTSLTSRRVVGRVSEIVSPANFDETLKNHHTSILKTFL